MVVALVEVALVALVLGYYARAAFCNIYCVHVVVCVSMVIVARGRWWWYILYVLYCTCYLCQEYGIVYIYIYIYI